MEYNNIITTPHMCGSCEVCPYRGSCGETNADYMSFIMGKGKEQSSERA